MHIAYMEAAPSQQLLKKVEYQQLSMYMIHEQYV